MDQETWRFINSFAPWLSAIGTLLAVALSLYLARSDRRINLFVNTGIRLFVPTQDTSETKDIVVVSVTNIGRRSTTVSGLYWRFGIFKKQTFIREAPQHAMSCKFPVKLGDGDEALFFYTLDEFDSTLKEIANGYLNGVCSGARVRSFKVGISTTSKQNFEVPFERSLRKHLLAITKKNT